MKSAKYVMKKHKRMCSFWEYLFQKFRKFPRKASRWNCFFKRSCRLPDTGNVLLGNLWNFKNRFHKKHPRMPASAVVAGKCFDQNIFFKKYLIRVNIQWHVLPGIKCITSLKTFHDVYQWKTVSFKIIYI